MNIQTLLDASLYIIVDPTTNLHCSIEDTAYEAICGGADIIQYRDKLATDRMAWERACRLRELTAEHNIPLIVNDRIHLALAVEADGVHLGHEDTPVHVARRLMGSHRWLGVSTHSVQEAQQAVDAGADYVGIGPVRATPTKPTYPAIGEDVVGNVVQQLSIPAFAIGGIDELLARRLVERGVRRIAVVRAVATANDPMKMTERLKSILLTTERV